MVVALARQSSPHSRQKTMPIPQFQFFYLKYAAVGSMQQTKAGICQLFSTKLNIPIAQYHMMLSFIPTILCGTKLTISTK